MKKALTWAGIIFTAVILLVIFTPQETNQPAPVIDKAWEKRLADDADEYCRELGVGANKPLLYIECMKKREGLAEGLVIMPDGHGGTLARQYR